MMKSVATVLFLLMLGFSASAWAQGNAAKGKAIVDGKKCAICHKVGGPDKARPIEMLAGTRDDAFLKEAINNPKKAIRPDVKMPEAKLSAEDLQDVIAYLRSIAKR